MRLRSTIEFLGIWEKLNNNNFNLTEFDQIKNASGSNAFVMTATKWVKETNAIGIKPSRGKYSEGTFAHRDIALVLAILSNLEYLNSMLIAQKLSQQKRLVLLNKEANREKELFNKNNVKPVKSIEKK